MPFECHVFSKAGTRKFLVEKHLQNPMWKVVSAFATALFSVIMGIPLYWGVSQEAHYILPVHMLWCLCRRHCLPGCRNRGPRFSSHCSYLLFLNVKTKQLLVFVSSVLQSSCLGMGVWVRGQSKWCDWCCPLNWPSWASLVIQWLRIHLVMQGTPVQSWVREDPTCLEATKPLYHNYQAPALKSASHNYWSPSA